MNRNQWRLLNPDGSFNIEKARARAYRRRDHYHRLLSTTWPRLLGLLGATYLFCNLLFATAYFACGRGAIGGLQASTDTERFIDCFFFSVQTLATIGYGSMSPAGMAAHLIVTVEALAGILGLAIVTGLLFARFSRPTAKVIFSEKAVITKIDGAPCFMFRMANARLNQIVEANTTVILSRNETTAEGMSFRELYDMKLERPRTPLFALSWMVVHYIDKDSPLYEYSIEKMRDSETEIFVTVLGTDDTFSQAIHARHSYVADDIECNRSFVDVLSRTPEGKVRIDLDRINELRDA